MPSEDAMLDEPGGLANGNCGIKGAGSAGFEPPS
jgi:hypothetical protein